MKRIIVVTGLSLFLLSFGMPTTSLAGETIKWKAKHINVSTKFEPLEIGDEAGHVIALAEAKGLCIRTEGPEEQPYKLEVYAIGDYRGDGTGTDRGYGKWTYTDGSTYYGRWVDSVIKDGHASATVHYYGGTGRWEGLKGVEKAECEMYGDRFICDVEVTVELP